MGACYGDALMAALGVGYEGFEDYSKLTGFIRDGAVYRPDGEQHRRYQSYQKIYDQLYGATRELANRLSDIENSRSGPSAL